ncbi:hypothetical protein QBC35DRAFT_296614 [Podospora australis]|uniref:Uncharacterized protein n=1 Tax=Podospora australis TaxID=1536484 RepID=A0AAN7AH63_9PEZI|nr:hypothetical protein QBC35DRAFT_296614 [Podospora australis]
MPQNTNTNLKLSGEETSSRTETSYALEQYLKSDREITDRLLGDFNIRDVIGRVQAVKNEVDTLLDEISQPSQDSS